MLNVQAFFRVFSSALTAGLLLTLGACGQPTNFVEQSSSQPGDTADAATAKAGDANIRANASSNNGTSDGSQGGNGDCGQANCSGSDQTAANATPGSTSSGGSTTTTGSTTKSGSTTTTVATTTTGTTSNPTSGDSTPPPTSIKTLDFGSLWSAGDDGSYFYLNLDTGVWDWKNMTVYNPNYDSTRCQDYVGLIGAMNVTNRAGVVTTANVNMDWRFNPTCNTLPKEFVGNPALPGTWGTSVNLLKATVTPTGGDGTMKITQVGRFLRFDVYHSISAKVNVTFSN